VMTKEKVRDALASVLGFKPAKTVRHKLLVIVVHVLLWGLFLILPLFIYRIRIPDIRFFYREIINKAFLIILFYFHFYYLLPRFFKKRQVLNYVLSLVAALILLCAQQLILEIFFLKTFERKLNRFYLATPGSMITKIDRGPLVHVQRFRGEEGEDSAFVPGRRIIGASGGYGPSGGYGAVAYEEVEDIPDTSGQPGVKVDAPEAGVILTSKDPDGPFRVTTTGPPPFFKERFPRMMYMFILRDALSSGIVILLLSGFIKLAHSLFVSEKQKKILENERLNAELNFLKLQINPHFLFNTLNSIYSQAHFRSEQTEHSILKFSRIMRYVLYDSSADKIPLLQDLDYISNYIDLQKLRLSKNITIQYDVTGSMNGLVIAPLLLITFIENAFKHGISYTAPSEINISINVIENELMLTVGNAITQSSRESSGGVGLINAQRRLDVLYPNRHLLDVIENDHLYIVNLKIELDYES
jgi:two-component system LytT family sensor kinase